MGGNVKFTYGKPTPKEERKEHWWYEVEELCDHLFGVDWPSFHLRYMLTGSWKIRREEGQTCYNTMSDIDLLVPDKSATMKTFERNLYGKDIGLLDVVKGGDITNCLVEFECGDRWQIDMFHVPYSNENRPEPFFHLTHSFTQDDHDYGLRGYHHKFLLSSAIKARSWNESRGANDLTLSVNRGVKDNMYSAKVAAHKPEHGQAPLEYDYRIQNLQRLLFDKRWGAIGSFLALSNSINTRFNKKDKARTLEFYTMMLDHYVNKQKKAYSESDAISIQHLEQWSV